MTSGGLSLGVHRADDDVVLSVAGEVDLASAETLRSRIVEAALEHRVPRVVLDLAALEFIDSTGLSALVSAQRSLAQTGTTMALRAPSAPVLRLLEVTGLDQAFPVVE